MNARREVDRIEQMAQDALLRQKEREDKAGTPPALHPGIENVKRTSSYCPVQVEGTFDGVSFYFRARWDSWQIEVGDTTPTWPPNKENWFYGEQYSNGGAEASWMPRAHVHERLNKAYKMWREKQ